MFTTLHAQALFVSESFEDTAFTARGWYDGSGATLSSTEKYAGTRSFECRFARGGTGCVGGTPRRHLFTDSDGVYVSYYIKHSANWVGSGKPYHPHMFLLLTNADSQYAGPAYTHLTGYIEEVDGTPQVGIQDGANIDETRIGVDLTSTTEKRAVAGCNGDSDGYGAGDCYLSGSVHWNGKMWKLGQRYFDNTLGGPYYKGDWHVVESYFRLNTVANGKGLKDGLLQYWFDGALVLNRTDVVFRTGAQPGLKFNQFILAPFIGDGSPADQTFWVDNLVIAANRPAAPPVPPRQAPAPPTNVRIIR
jgi:hypothetical protein